MKVVFVEDSVRIGSCCVIDICLGIEMVALKGDILLMIQIIHLWMCRSDAIHSAKSESSGGGAFIGGN